MNNTLPFSVTILTKNSTKFLIPVIQALKSFDEVVIFDTGSTDDTLLIASQFPNVKIFKGQLNGFGPTHNAASACAKNDWILSIDSDEVVSQELVDELCHLTLDTRAVYSVSRKNFYKGKWIRWCGWHPDRQIRLYHRHTTSFDDALVHETIIATGLKKIPLTNAIYHYSYTEAADFLAKMQSYSSLFARQNKGKKSSSPLKAFLHGLFAFFKSYILKRGFLGGSQGFEISFYNASTAYYKYIKLHEANQES